MGSTTILMGDRNLEGAGVSLNYDTLRRTLIAETARPDAVFLESVTGINAARLGAPARRRASCVNCGAPAEPICSYCLTPGQ